MYSRLKHYDVISIEIDEREQNELKGAIIVVEENKLTEDFRNYYFYIEPTKINVYKVREKPRLIDIVFDEKLVEFYGKEKTRKLREAALITNKLELSPVLVGDKTLYPEAILDVTFTDKEAQVKVTVKYPKIK